VKSRRYYSAPSKWKRTYGGLSAGGFTLKGPFSINWVEVRYRTQLTDYVRCRNHRLEYKTDIRDQRSFRVNVTVGYGFAEYEHAFYSHGWETLPE
jgi:outer membrane protease